MQTPVCNVDLDQLPHYVASDLGLHYLPMTFYGFPDKNGLIISDEKWRCAHPYYLQKHSSRYVGFG